MSTPLTYTVKFLRKGEPVGSGFFVHKDGLIATCVHVLRDCLDTPEIETLGASFQLTTLEQHTELRATCIEIDEVNDVALLKLNGKIPDEATVATLIPSDLLAKKLYNFAVTAYGKFTDKDYQYDFLSASGTISGFFKRSKRKTNNLLASRMIQLKSEEILPGMSGAPVTIPDLGGGVVGILSGRYNIDPKTTQWMTRTAWATQIEALVALDRENRLVLTDPISPSNLRDLVSISRGPYSEIGIHHNEEYKPAINPGRWKRPSGNALHQNWEIIIGREKELGFIGDYFHRYDGKSAKFAVFGLAGMGKSSLVAEYINKFGGKDAYPGGVLWASVSAETTQDIFLQWLKEAYQEDEWITYQPGHSQIQIEPKFLRQLLDGHGCMLVILDGVQHLDTIQLLLESIPSETHILLTTREHSIARKFMEPNDYDALELQKLNENEALKLLMHELRNLSADELRPLVVAAGAHPQTLRICSAIIRTRNTHEKQKQILDALIEKITGGENIDDSQSLFQALQLIYDQIGDSTDVRKTFQKRIRFLGILLPSELGFSSEMAATLWDTDLDTAIDFLEILSQRLLVQQTKDGRWYQHPLIRAKLQKLLEQENDYEEALQNYIIVAYQVAMQSSNILLNYDEIAKDLPHLHHVGSLLINQLENLLQVNITSMDVSDILNYIVSTEQVTEFKDGFEIIQAIVRSSGIYLLNSAINEELVNYWLAAGYISATSLDEADNTIEILAYWCKWLGSKTQFDYVNLLLQQAGSLVEKSTDPGNLRLWLWSEQANVKRSLGETDEALVILQKSLVEILDNDEIDTAIRINVYRDLGALYLSISEVEKALHNFKNAIKLFSDQSGGMQRLEITQALAICYTELGDFQEALRFYEEAEPYLNTSADLSFQATLLNNKGYILLSLGDLQEAENNLGKALNLSKRTNNFIAKINVLNNLAIVEIARTNYEKALQYLHEAQDANQLILYQRGNALTLGNIGTVYYFLGEFSNSLEYLKQAMLLLRHIHDKGFLSKILVVIGKVFQSTGQISEGIAFFNEVLPVIQELKYTSSEITIIQWMGLLYGDDGDSQRALQLFEQAIPGLEKINDLNQRAPALMLTAYMHYSLGNISKSVETLEEALVIWRRLGNKSQEIETLIYLTNYHLMMRDFIAAEERLNECEILFSVDDIESTPLRAAFLKVRGQVYLIKDQIELARSDFNVSAQICAEIGDFTLFAANLSNIATSYMHQGNIAEARRWMLKALDGVRETSLPQLQSLVQSNLGIILLVEGQLDRGKELIRSAIDLLEQNGLVIDSAGQTVELLNFYQDIFTRTNIQSNRNEVLPEEKLEILLHTTNWDVLEALLTMEEFRSVDIYNLINRQLLVVKDENLKEILRIFRQLYDWVLNGEGNDAFVRMRNNFEGSAIYEWRGRVYLASNGYSAALAQFNRSIEIDDNNPSSHVNRGWTFRGIGNYTTAIEDFDTALNAEPAFHDAYLGRGVCHFETGNYGLSLSDLTNAIKNNKNSVYAFQWRGTLHLYMGDAVTALEDINLSIKLDSNNLSHYYWRGLIYLKSGDFKKGLADFTRVIENDVPYSLSVSYAFLWRGMCHIFSGKQKYGQGDWEVAIDMSKKIINPVRNSLLQGLYHLMLKEFEQSKAMYTTVLTMRYVPHVLITQANHIQLISELYEENSIDGLSKWLRGEIDARLGNTITARG